MKKGKNKIEQAKRARLVEVWFASFSLLAFATALAVACYLSNIIWLYVICGAVLVAFVALYSWITKKIMHKDGYTLVQALWFYRICKKEGIEMQKIDPHKMEKIMKLAAEKDFAKRLKPTQVAEMLKVGRELSASFFDKEGI